MRRTAVFPGSFDPLTTGHLDLIERGCRIFERLIVAVAVNPRKQCLFTTGERMAMIGEAAAHLGDAVEVDFFDGLLVNYARSKGACAILRGLRVVSDFEYEFQMASMNRHLAPEIETLLVIPGEGNHYVSSGIVKEVAAFGGDVTGLVPPTVHSHLLRRVGRSETGR
ncbi:MAG: pantetheine-phosphate adenylyltransferase [Deltaproteobacteria bacterium]|nr:pantetheine-phosphate adenylyltransferase [Deltaproteobacteria bacterium]